MRISSSLADFLKSKNFDFKKDDEDVDDEEDKGEREEREEDSKESDIESTQILDHSLKDRSVITSHNKSRKSQTKFPSFKWREIKEKLTIKQKQGI